MDKNTVLGAIFAGGAGKRMGKPKGTAMLGTIPLIAHVAACLTPQVGQLMICAGPDKDVSVYRDLGIALVGDETPDRAGPTAALLAALNWADQQTTAFVLTAPCDMPFLPANLCRQFAAAAQPGSPIYATSDAGAHYGVALWPVCLKDRVRDQIINQDIRSLRGLLATNGASTSHFNANQFADINTPEELAAAELRFNAGQSDDPTKGTVA